ncbi:hypothetical protein BDR06DRAFT_253905 [Suillus hirtellus]|nr:hypothetical protein BDR06DRAFT_253905 [Suillus hirtellus]
MTPGEADTDGPLIIVDLQLSLKHLIFGLRQTARATQGRTGSLWLCLLYKDRLQHSTGPTDYQQGTLALPRTCARPLSLNNRMVQPSSSNTISLAISIHATTPPSLMRHGQRWHGDAQGGGEIKKTTCPWSGCDNQMLANAIPRHIPSAHFGVVWICTGTGCLKPFGRHDSFKAHS